MGSLPSSSFTLATGTVKREREVCREREREIQQHSKSLELILCSCENMAFPPKQDTPYVIIYHI